MTRQSSKHDKGAKIIERIESEAGVPGLAGILAEELVPTDLQSLLLEVYGRRAAGRTPAMVLSEYEKNRFAKPSPVPMKRMLEWEQAVLAELPPGFGPLILSPVCPLGTASVVTSVSQDWAVATSRNTEVVSDSTAVLALECAMWRRTLLRSNPKSAEQVHLAASHRLLRGQKFEGPDSYPHFAAFALCSAGRDAGNLGFELETIAIHAGVYAAALQRILGKGIRLRFEASDFSPAVSGQIIESRLFNPLRERFAALECVVNGDRRSGRNYYRDVCFKIYAERPGGGTIELADGGSVDWTRKLLGSAKERLIISGIGSERVCTAFGK